jgi:hypothetical protein
MLFCFLERLRSKTAVDNNIIQVSTFNYFGRSMSCEGEEDIGVKINKSLKGAGFININFKPQSPEAHWNTNL